MLGSRTERIGFRRGKRQGLVMTVGERYLRSDVACGHRLCGSCQQNAELARRGVAQLDTGIVVVPDGGVVSRFMGVLEETPGLHNVVFCQTVADALDRRGRTRTARRIRGFASDTQRASVVFANDVCAATHGGSGDAVARVAAWYRSHLAAGGVAARVVLVTLGAGDGGDTWRLAEFLAEFHPDSVAQYEAARAATQDADDVTAMTAAEHARARLVARAGGEYPAHAAPGAIADGLRDGSLVRGTLRMAARGGEARGVVERAGGGSVEVVGRRALNRACGGDTVVVRLMARGGEGGGGAPGGESGGESDGAVDAGDDAAGGGSAQLRGVVVGVSERRWRPFVATLQPDDGGGTRHLAVPVDAAVPKIRMHYADAAALARRYFVVAIDEWPCDSLYPLGHFVRPLGLVGDLDAEVDVILVERQIAVSQAALRFPVAVMREMPVWPGWAPDAADLALRRDLRDQLVFSIDPRGCQDIDDAVSMRRVPAGFELGVHIADVTHFVAPASAADAEAMARATTVYLADRRFNMIPEVLSEQICSLRAAQDSLAVSVIWTLDAEYRTTAVWFGRTVIRSACEMSYEQAQALLDGASHVEGLDPAREPALRECVAELTAAMRVLRQRRYDAGALELASTEIKFVFDPESGRVVEARPKPTLEIHRVIEEAMVFANAAVADRIFSHLPAAALLRRHRSPTTDRFARLVDAARSRGHAIECGSNRELAESLRRMAREVSDPDMLFLAKSMATLAMQEAEYFATGECSKDDYAHYGLAVGFYTHFTSPIRRYADVIVHRQLLAAIEGPPSSSLPLSLQWVAATSERLNERNRQSKRAQRESTELFQSRYVTQLTKGGQVPLVADGVVAEIRTNGLIVYVPAFGLRGPVRLRDAEGRIKIPRSTLSGNAADVNDFIDGCSDFAAHAARLEVRLPLNVPVFQLAGGPVLSFALFDRVRVSLRVLETSRRRPPVYLSLVSRASSTGPMRAYRSSLPSVDRPLPKKKLESEVPVVAALEVPATAAAAAAAAVASDKKLGGKSGGGCYEVLEKFSQMSLLETTCDVQNLL